jgi:hypothetical protein
MAHYAFLDQNNIVTEVIVGKEEGEDGVDWEAHYGAFRGQTCKRTSYNSRANEHLSGGVPFRKNFAGIGFLYRADLDAFVPPQPYASWVLDEETATWHPPVAKPNDGQRYVWDETTMSWISVEQFNGVSV